jgi:Zn-dependent peptidase ImmA (M78 family)
MGEVSNSVQREGESIMPVRRKHIRLLVDDLLYKCRVQSPPVPIESIARALGAEVRFQHGDDELSGFLFRDHKQQKAVIGVNSTHHENRQRFTIAHEIGHFLLHEWEGVHVDGSDRAFQIKRRDEKSSTGTDIDEQEANLFAAELLMPAKFLKTDLLKIKKLDLLDDNLGSFARLAERYEVSTQALTFRLAYLGYVRL